MGRRKPRAEFLSPAFLVVRGIANVMRLHLRALSVAPVTESALTRNLGEAVSSSLGLSGDRLPYEAARLQMLDNRKGRLPGQALVTAISRLLH